MRQAGVSPTTGVRVETSFLGTLRLATAVSGSGCRGFFAVSYGSRRRIASACGSSGDQRLEQQRVNMPGVSVKRKKAHSVRRTFWENVVPPQSLVAIPRWYIKVHYLTIWHIMVCVPSSPVHTLDIELLKAASDASSTVRQNPKTHDRLTA